MINRPTIIEVVGKLPVPFAGHLMEQYNYNVIKVEAKAKPDTFSLNLENDLYKLFNAWYENLNFKKTIVHIGQDNQEGNCLKNIFSHIYSPNVIILTSKKNCPLKNFINKLKKKLISEDYNYKHFLIGSNALDSPLHDINLAAKFGIINQKSNQPLKYPLIGILFGSQLALEISNAIFDNTEEIIYFESKMDALFKPLEISQMYSPIQGKILGYNLYKIKNGRLALSAIESRTWNNFIKKLNIHLDSSDRFCSKEGKRGKIIEKALEGFSKDDLDAIFINADERCYTFLDQ